MDIYINNNKYKALDNETIIQVADRHDIHIPRFCYHKRLSIVASCRMCLVEVEGAKYPQPACSTIVRDGMRINTSGLVTEDAQKSTMEFLLINHPLDCPVCDQAGECELQDISLDHGDYKSNYKEIKRTVIDKDIGNLVTTEMTRCIHCSRCVRFGEEVAGIKELGMTGRGEKTKIETFVNQSLTSELSGNVIDLCPVGALNNNLYKYSARTWDLKQISSISSNDCLGSNINYHTYKDEIKRTVPKENDQINLSWLADSDRFGYEGIESEERILFPLIRSENKLIKSDMDTLNQAVSEQIQEHTSKTTAVMSAQASCEEMYLFQKILRDSGISNIDHRSKECDFRYQENYPVIPSFDIKLSEIASMENIILVNVNISKEFPILSVYLRNAVKQKSTSIISLSAYEYLENFDISHSETLSPKELEKYFSNTSNNILSNINKEKKNLIIMGPSLSYLKNYSSITNNVSRYAKSINSKLSLLGDQCNTSGAWAMGVVPHRLPGGEKIEEFNQKTYLSPYSENDLLIIYNLEPEYDFSNDTEIINRLKKSKFNVFFSSYMTDSINKYADAVYPLAVQQESYGSYLNTNKQLQVFNQVISPRGESMNGLNLLLGLSRILGINIDKNQISKDVNKILSKINNKSNYVLIDSIEMTNQSNTLEKIIIRSSNSNNPTLRRCKSLLTTHDNDDFMSIPNSMKINSESKITINELENSFKIKTNIKVHNKPDNTILVKMNGRYAQKIGSYNTSVDLS
tara:strand:+ start:1322 stop:3562 length:2241 start_codon:yes stop_codon:yes gene_type:complete